MVINGDVISLKKEEAIEIIDKECQKRLGMNLGTFEGQRKQGKLPESLAVQDIDALLRFANGNRKY